MENLAKVIFTAMAGIVTYMTNNFTPLILVLGICVILDYVLGIYIAIRNKKVSATKALDGFFKKVFYFFIIIVAFCFDFMIYSVGDFINLTAPPIFGILATCYMLSMEIISILENASKLNIKIPFLTGAVKSVSEKIEENAIFTNEREDN